MPPLPHHPASREHAADGLIRIAPLVSRWVERLLDGHQPSLTLAQFLTLQAVADGDVVGSELARRTTVSPAAISQLLASLESDGLIERMRAPADRRRQTLALSEAGRVALRSAQALLRQQVGLLLADVPPHEAQALARLLETVQALFVGTAPPPRPRRPPPPR